MEPEGTLRKIFPRKKVRFETRTVRRTPSKRRIKAKFSFTTTSSTGIDIFSPFSNFLRNSDRLPANIPNLCENRVFVPIDSTRSSVHCQLFSHGTGSGSKSRVTIFLIVDTENSIPSLLRKSIQLNFPAVRDGHVRPNSLHSSFSFSRKRKLPETEFPFRRFRSRIYVDFPLLSTGKNSQLVNFLDRFHFPIYVSFPERKSVKKYEK